MKYLALVLVLVHAIAYGRYAERERYEDAILFGAILMPLSLALAAMIWGWW